MAGNTTKDMTTGSPTRLILGFFFPMLFGMLFQQLYSMVDTMIVGKYLGVDALAAVGSTGSINFMVIGFCMGVCNGFAIPVAQKFGEKNDSQLRRLVANGAWLSIGMAVVMTVAVCLLCRNILIWMRTPEDILEEAYAYIFVIFLGIPATYLYNMVSGIIRSLGDSRTPLVFLVISSVLNVVLDLYMIVALGMGVAGAAWATVISQGISGACCLAYMAKHYDVLRMTREEARLDGKLIRHLCGMGLPMGMQYSITAIGSVVLQTAVNGLGSMAVAAVTAGTKIGLFFCCPYEAMGSTMATYGGQNMGARKLDRIGRGLRSAVILGGVYSLLALIALWLFGKPLGLLFLDAGQTEVLDQVYLFLMINSSCYFLLSLVNTVRFLIQGMGYSRLAVFAGGFEMVARSFVGFCLVPVFGFPAACMANPCAWLAADLFLIPAYFRIMRRL